MSKKIIRNSLSLLIASSLAACGGGSDGGNSAPTVESSTLAFQLNEDSQLTGQIIASDTNGDVLAFGLGQSPANGSLSIDQNGAFIFTPNSNFFGEDSAQIVVSDSIDEVRVDLSFTIQNINDLPEIVTSSVAISSTGETEGKIEAIDVDDDVLVFEVVTQPSLGTVVIDSATGAFTYQHPGIENVSDSVIISVSDSIGDPVVATVSLSPSYVSNDDKLAYYYASSHSHLAKAESYINSDSADDTTEITDAEITADVYSELAVGYTEAGFPELAESNAISNIIDRPTRARAYLDSAVELDALGDTDQANAFRTKAIAQYNAYIAEIGITNIRSTDALFYLEAVRSYVKAEQSEEATDLFSVIRIYADANLDEESPHTSAYGYFLQAAKDYAEERVAIYLEASTQNNFDFAYEAINFQRSLAEQGSYQERSDYRYYQVKTFHLVDATRSAHYLSLVGDDINKASAETLAKSLLALSLSLYSDIDYDENYAMPADEYAQYTLLRYPTGVGLLSGIFNALYPDYVNANKDDGYLGNLPIKLVTEEEGVNDADTLRAYRDHYAYQLLNDAKNGIALDETINNVETLFTTTYTDTEYAAEALVEQDHLGILDQRAAWLLSYAGYNEQAKYVISEAIRIVSTTPYLEDVNYSLDKMVDDQGCLRYVNLYQKFGGESTDITAPLAACENILTTYFSDDTYISDANRVTGLLTGASIYELGGKTENAIQILDDASELATTLEDFETQLEHRIEVTNTYASLGYLEQALSQFVALTDDAIALLDNTPDITERVEAVDDILGELEYAYEPDDENSFTGTYQLFEAVKRHAGNNTQYAQAIAALNEKAQQVQAAILTHTSDFADNEKLSVYEQLIEQYSWLALFDEATALAQNAIYTDADRNSLFANIAIQAATKDDFPASTVANVDTDADGLPNFFLSNATEQDIILSGLIADTDADGDGLVDQEDLSPLDPN
ncbi:hypothetical protein AVL56_16295 [Alteromonas stellipolaris]|uniref:Ig-like domain-containing protein n=1 Tax=Alteromonas stellipolaris TaxID=233316 RepID=UPI0007704A53|nr:Ig-like domain-containing protein [Alteromonas stellipolaris]AMJ95713.1 hypothetical protein AVL56_16295 [Alteromonas stellipolaris]